RGGRPRNEIHGPRGGKKAAPHEPPGARMDKELPPFYPRLDSEPFSDELLQREETRELVNATMSQLPEHYRETLEAKYVNGSSVRDLAGRLHVSEKAVESQLTRARKAFRATFLALARNLGAELC